MRRDALPLTFRCPKGMLSFSWGEDDDDLLESEWVWGHGCMVSVGLCEEPEVGPKSMGGFCSPSNQTFHKLRRSAWLLHWPAAGQVGWC